MITGDDPVAVEPVGGVGQPIVGQPRVLSITEDDVMTALKAFVHEVLPDLTNDNVVQGQQNNVPMPLGPDFVLLIPTGRSPIATTVHGYDPNGRLRDTTRSTRMDVFCNFYGPSSADYSMMFAILLRDMFGCDFLRDYGVQPLWSDDPRQMPLIDDARQYEARWLVQAHVQFNPTVSTSQQFADTVKITVLEAD